MEIKMGPVMGKTPAVAGVVSVKEGQSVEEGQILAQIETGKGNRPIKSPAGGTIRKVLCREGSRVCSGQVLFLLEEQESGREEEKTPLEAELFIIGGGPGGYVAALYAAKQGMQVVLAEKNLLGGTCLNCGCIPTKALIQSGQMYRAFREAKEFGIQAPEIKMDGKQAFARKDAVCAELRSGVENLLLGAGVTVLKGTARLTGKNSAVVETADKGQEIRFAHALVGAGSKPVIPEFASGTGSGCLTDSEQALGAGKFPESAVIIGGGVIGMEFAFLYQSIGAKVYVIEYTDHILGTGDRDVSQVILEEAKNKGIRIYTGAKVTAVQEAESGQAVVSFEKDGKQCMAAAQTVLLAAGRRPATEGLGLEEAGVALTKGGAIQTDSHMRTNIPGIYAIGDVNGRLALAHGASRQGIIAVDDIRGRESSFDRELVPSVIFTRPEAAFVGKTEEDCKREGISVTISKFPFSANGKAKIMGEAEGFVKLVRRNEDRVLVGGAVVGPDASALISVITAAVSRKMTDEEIAGLVFAHPTTSEAVWEAALGLSVGALHSQG